MNFSTFVNDLCLKSGQNHHSTTESHQRNKSSTAGSEQRISISKETERFLMVTGDNKLSFKSGMRTLAHTVTS